ncbi:hypothetical protein [Stutzerimonas xanthomarina]|uniref:hypothetical protein n=1 Tax=Stutzerimonas xanthomarina TaxID=271420 RepID=UPI003AA9B13D
MKTNKRLTPFISMAAQQEPAEMALLPGSYFSCVTRRLDWTLNPCRLPSIYADTLFRRQAWLAESTDQGFNPRPAEALNACDFTQEKKG